MKFKRIAYNNCNVEVIYSNKQTYQINITIDSVLSFSIFQSLHQMYLVNPHYQSLRLTATEMSKKTLEIQTVLSIPKSERKDQDNRKIYEYFIQNPILIEIQRCKSLRARILCTAQIQLVSEYAFAKTQTKSSHTTQNQKQTPSSHNKMNSLFFIIEKFPQEMTLAVIKTEKKQQIMRKNQQPIRRQMDQMRQYAFLKQFQYHQLLYLAHFVQKVDHFTYNNFLFKQNEKADFVYFIEEGEFQVFQDFHLRKEKSLTKINISQRKGSLKTPLQLEESPYKKREIKVNRQEIARLSGGFGQCFGQVELCIESENRAYSLRCNSSTSIIFKIHFKRFQQIFKEDQHQFKKMKKEYLQKYQSDLQKVKHNQNLKDKIIYAQTIFPNSIERQNSPERQKVSSIIFQMQRQKSLQNSQFEGSFTLPSNSSTIIINQHNLKKNINRQRKMYSQNARKFNVHRYGSGFSSQISTLNSDHSRTIDSKEPQDEGQFFPVISKTYTQKKLNEDTKLPSIMNPSKRHNRMRGLIDISTIIQGKQQLQNLMTNIPNPEFSFYRLDQKNAKRLNFRKSQLEKVEMEKSAAHSENFLKSLIKRSLKKSGYLPKNTTDKKGDVSTLIFNRQKTQTIQNVPSFSILQQEQNAESFDYKEKEEKYFALNKQIRASLVSNDFDKFFYEI